MQGLNIYFLLKFGLANAINDYLRLKFVLCALGIFNLKCLSIKFVTPNLSQIYFCIPENNKTNVSNQFLSWCEMFVLKLFGIQKVLIDDKKYKVHMILKLNVNK